MTCIFFNDKIGALYHGRPIQYIRPNFFEDKDKGWNCGLVWVSITSENRKCPKNRKLPEKQWEQPDNVIFLFSQICRIQTKNVGIIPKMMRSIWFWSQISINATKMKKKWHFLSQPIIFNVKVCFFGYRKWSKPLPSHNFNLCLSARKKFGRIIVWEAVMERPDFHIEKKTRQYEYSMVFISMDMIIKILLTYRILNE